MTFLLGLGYHSKYGTTFAIDDRDLKESFDFFNKLDPKGENIRQQINDGAQLFSGAPLIKVGTYMAERIKERHGENRLDDLRRNGSLPFF